MNTERISQLLNSNNEENQILAIGLFSESNESYQEKKEFIEKLLNDYSKYPTSVRIELGKLFNKYAEGISKDKIKISS